MVLTLPSDIDLKGLELFYYQKKMKQDCLFLEFDINFAEVFQIDKELNHGQITVIVFAAIAHKVGYGPVHVLRLVQAKLGRFLLKPLERIVNGDILI